MTAIPLDRTLMDARKAGNASRRWPAMGEVEKLDRMQHRNRCAALQLRDAADVAGSDEIGRGLHDIRDLAVAQPQGDFLSLIHI